MPSDLQVFVKEFGETIDGFMKDIEALSHDLLDQTWGLGSRTGYDIVYEVGIINMRVAARFKGEDPGPMPWEFGKEWLKAPEEFRNKQVAKKHIRQTAEAVNESLGEDLERLITVGDESKPLYLLLNFATMHTSYHDAQLNFIQQMSGDMTIHW